LISINVADLISVDGFDKVVNEDESDEISSELRIKSDHKKT